MSELTACFFLSFFEARESGMLTSGFRRVRLLSPCGDDSCQWVDDQSNYLTTRRWYTTV